MIVADTFEQALALHREGRLREAEPLYRAVIAAEPNHFSALHHLGIVLMTTARMDEALQILTRAVAADPRSAVAENDLGIALAQLARHADALEHFRSAVTIDPRSTQGHANLGATLGAMGRHEEAIAAYRRALALDPNAAEIHASLGNALKTLGRIAQSREAFETAIALAPGRARIYHHLSEVKRFAPGDAHAAAMEQLARDPAMPQDERVFVHFALAKVYADLGRADDSFEQLIEGNRLKRAQVKYDETAVLGLLERVARVFTPELMRAKAGQGDPSPLPVFVIGMPRSGSTLVEQILASHPRVFGAGESTAFNDAVKSALQGRRFPETVAEMDAVQLHAIGARHVATMHALAPQAEGVVDKTLGNFAHAGMIHLALPNARIVHVRRDPADSCVSCFSKLFASEFRYSYDLGELGRYYRAYAALMEHWLRVLPDGVVLDVQYEDLVADFEPQARRIVAHVGLEWDVACLSFHETERAVGTFSAAQVRQPIYKGAVGRWRQHEKFLQPLLRELDDTRH
jgi:tetratricopeptide (TPR) repeat protein